MSVPEPDIYEFDDFRLDAVKRVLLRRGEVLPFKPIVAESRDEALELGMADTLIARLSNSREIIVRPLSSVRRYGGLEQDPQVAGRELGVESVLDGSIQRSADRIRVTARLIKVEDGASQWVGTFDEKFSDVFAVQDAISERVASALALRLTAEERRGLTRRYTEDTEAYELYLKGRYHANKLIPPEVRKGIQFFQQAIEQDPTYALAYTGLADAYRSLPMTSDAPPKDGNTQTISMIGYAWALSGERAPALAALDELKALSTQRYVPPYNLAMVYNGLGHDDETLNWLERAYEARDVILSAFITVDPNWDRLRANPRFAAILEGMNLE
jgi:TolB-like protein